MVELESENHHFFFFSLKSLHSEKADLEKNMIDMKSVGETVMVTHNLSFYLTLRVCSLLLMWTSNSSSLLEYVIVIIILVY